MDIALNRLFLYATILLTGITTVGILYYLQDRKRRSRALPDLGDLDRLAVLEREITRLADRLKALEFERDSLRDRMKRSESTEDRPGTKDQSPRST